MSRNLIRVHPAPGHRDAGRRRTVGRGVDEGLEPERATQPSATPAFVARDEVPRRAIAGLLGLGAVAFALLVLLPARTLERRAWQVQGGMLEAVNAKQAVQDARSAYFDAEIALHDFLVTGSRARLDAYGAAATQVDTALDAVAAAEMHSTRADPFPGIDDVATLRIFAAGALAHLEALRVGLDPHIHAATGSDAPNRDSFLLALATSEGALAELVTSERAQVRHLARLQPVVGLAGIVAFFLLTVLALLFYLRAGAARLRRIESMATDVVPGFDAAPGVHRDAMARLEATVDGVQRRVTIERERLRFTLDGARIGLWTIDPDARELTLEGRPRESVSTTTEGLAWLPGDFDAWRAMVHEDDWTAVEASMRGALEARETFETEYRLLGPDARVRWILMRGQCFYGEGADGSVRPMLKSVAIDITRRKRAEEAVRDARERHLALLTQLQEVVFQADAEGRWRFLNPAWSESTGFDVAATMGRLQREFLHPDDVDRVNDVRRRLMAGTLERSRIEVRMLTRDGGWRRFELASRAVRTPDGTVQGTHGVMHDVTVERETQAALREANAQLALRVEERTKELRHVNERLVHGAFHDGLTGLANRALFVDRVGHALERARLAHPAGCAVLAIDLDRFKVVNAGIGHAAGDEVLRLVGERLESWIRSADTAARLGANVFGVLLEGLDGTTDAKNVMERLSRVFVEPVEVRGNDVFLTASMGLAVGGPGYEEAEELIRDAELAMEEARRAGRGSTVVFEARLLDRALATASLEADLRAALAADALDVHYQPIVSSYGGWTVGVEALARWRHPRHGPVSPGEFVPLAEETGLVIELDRFVLRRACSELVGVPARPGRPPLHLSVNLSSQQFARADLVDAVLGSLSASRLEPSRLDVEMTESVWLDASSHVASNLAALKRLGIGFHIDDFGTGYSSLSYLQRFSADALKIDRAFVTNSIDHQESRELVRAIVEMAHRLRMRVVAEGVENAEQLELLRQVGCEYVQGYYFAPPMSLEDLHRYLMSEVRAEPAA